MTDPYKAPRQDMQSKAANELIGIQAHLLFAPAVAVILVAESHLLVVHCQDTTVGDSDLMGVPPQVLHH